jgi:phage-related protein
VSNVGYATLTVMPSAKGFASALSGEVDGPMDSVGRSGGQKSGGAFAGAFKGLVGPALALVGTAAIGGFVTGAVASAGQLQQSIGAIETVFKGGSAQMLAWSDQAAMSAGLSKNEFNELGTLIGSQLKNGGTAMDELGPKTNSLITAGADMASMFGGTTADAVGALSSALKGERDPIEKYGVSLNQASIDAKAAELGFSKVGGALSAEANQAATLALIMEQTADAHGNFAKEAATFSGQQERMKAGWANITASIGTAFLPVLTSVFSYVNSNVLPVIKSLADDLAKGTGAFAPIVGAVTAFGAAWKANNGDVTSNGLAGVFEQIANALRPVFDSFAQLAPKVGAAMAAFSPLGLLFRVLEPVLPAIATAVASLGMAFSGVLGVALTYLTPLISTLVSMLSGVLVAAMPFVLQMVSSLSLAFSMMAPVIMNVMNAIMPLVFSLINQLQPILMNLVTSVLPVVASVFGMVVTAIAPLVAQIAGALIPIIAALMPVVVTVFSVIANVVTAAMQIVQGIIQVVTGVITGNWSQVWDGILNIVSGVWNTIGALISGAIALVGSVISAGLNIVAIRFQQIFGGVLGFLGGVWGSITSGVSGMIGNVLGFFGGLLGKITGALSGAATALWSVGVNIIQGLINGIGSMMGAIGRAILSLVPGPIVGVFKDLLGIHSPSRVFRGFGVNIGEGLILGIRDMHGKVAASVEALGRIPAGASFSSPEIQAGGIQGALTYGSGQAGASGSPLIGNLTLQSSGNVQQDVEEVLFHTRRIARGGVYA